MAPSHQLDRFRLRACILLAAGASISALSGCHSAYIDATVRNDMPVPLSLVEVDYPSASFGRETLAPGATFHYRFKVLGNGSTKVLWTDPAQQEHTTPGPVLHEGDEGTVSIVLGPPQAQWDLQLKRR